MDSNGVLTISKLQKDLEKIYKEYGDITILCDFDSVVRIELHGEEKKHIVMVTDSCLKQIKEGH